VWHHRNYDSQPHDLFQKLLSFSLDLAAAADSGCHDDLADELLHHLTNWSVLARCDLACFFEPLSRCDPAFPRLLKPSDRTLDPYSLVMTTHDHVSGLPLNVLLRFQARGNFWYSFQLLSSLLRPGPAFDRVVVAAKDLAGFSTRHRGAVPSLHVRQGDGCSGDRKRSCELLAAYINASVLGASHGRQMRHQGNLPGHG